MRFFVQLIFGQMLKIGHFAAEAGQIRHTDRIQLAVHLAGGERATQHDAPAVLADTAL